MRHKENRAYGVYTNSLVCYACVYYPHANLFASLLVFVLPETVAQIARREYNAIASRLDFLPD